MALEHQLEHEQYTGLILSTTWRDTRHADGRPLPPTIAKAIRVRAEAWVPPVPVDEPYQEEFRRRLANAPKSVREAKFAGFALDLMLAWWIGDGNDPRPDRMLSALHICGFRDAMRKWGYSPNTEKEYIPGLNVLGKFGNPGHMEEWKALGQTPTSRTPYALAYSDDEAGTFFECAWAQAIVSLRDGMLGLLYLGLGVGLYPGPMTVVRGVDVRKFDDGSVRVRVGQAWLRVRPRYAAGLLDLAERVGDSRLVPGATSTNKTSPLKSDLKLPEEGPELKVERLVATFRWWLGRHVGTDALVEQCGTNAVVHLADLYKTMNRPSEPVERRWPVLDDRQDGPWASDWPARHYRSSNAGRS